MSDTRVRTELGLVQEITELMRQRTEFSNKAQECSDEIAKLLEQKQSLSSNQVKPTIKDDLCALKR